jgi:hypothetical protein
VTGILLHCYYQFSSGCCQGTATAKAQISASEAMRKDAQVPSVAPSVVGAVVGALVGALMGALVGALVSALVGGLGRKGAKKGAVQGPEWRKKFERKASGSK